LTSSSTHHDGWRERLPQSLRALASPFEVEDLLLAVWVLLLERLVLWYLGAGRAEPLPIEQAVFRPTSSVTAGPSGEEPHVFLTALGHLTPFGWLIVAGLLFVVVTRGRENRTLDDWLVRRFLVVPPPFFYGLHLFAFLTWVVARMRGRAPGPDAPGGLGASDRGRISSRRRGTRSVGPTSLDDPLQLPARTNEHLYWGPAAPRPLRRLAVVPAALLGESAFRTQILSFGSGFGSELTLSTISLAALRAADGTDIFKLGLETVLLLGAFAFLVAGPRIAAGSTLAWQAWVARFAMFAAATVAAARVPVG
jgi:hypothetical protein